MNTLSYFIMYNKYMTNYTASNSFFLSGLVCDVGGGHGIQILQSKDQLKAALDGVVLAVPLA